MNDPREKNFDERPVKDKSLSRLVKEADEFFSEFIRIRNADFKGMVKCFICGSVRFWKYQQCGHYIDRDQMAVRYDETNCQCVCESCNSFDNNHHERFKKALQLNYGDGQISFLSFKSKSLAKFTRSDLQSMIDEYKEKVANLKKSKHL